MVAVVVGVVVVVGVAVAVGVGVGIGVGVVVAVAVGIAVGIVVGVAVAVGVDMKLDDIEALLKAAETNNIALLHLETASPPIIRALLDIAKAAETEDSHILSLARKALEKVEL